MKRGIVIALAAATVVFIGLRVSFVLKSKRGARKATGSIPVSVQIVTPTDYDEILELTGSVEAVNQADVPAKVPGKIIRYLHDEGAWIDKGQVVVTLDRDEVGVEFKETTAEAPISGWLTKRYFDTGSHVAPGMPLFQIADYSRVKLAVSVPESDISRVRPGQAATVTIDAWPDREFPGTVRKVSPTVDYLSRTVKAEVAVGNSGLKLRPGMYGRAAVKVKHHAKGIVILSTAIMEREQGAQVFVVEGGQARVRTVEVGLDMGESSAIKGGLSFGDRLVVAGQHSITDGAAVEIVGDK